MLCVLILTYNEERILDKCLTALDFADHILVFDSFSSDGTVKIAAKHKATVIQRQFDDYAAQRNAALDSIDERYKWILMVDADEIVTPVLRKEIMDVVQSDPAHTMYRVRRKDFFQGKWIRYSSGYPTWFPRLFRYGTIKVEREINEEYVTTGSTGHLKEHLFHYPFNKGMDWWLEKHQLYADMEAKLMTREVKEPIKITDVFNSDPVIRRKAQKRLSYHIPYRPTFIFMAFYVLKRGFLDGKAGLDFCRLRYRYERLIEDKYNYYKQYTSNAC